MNVEKKICGELSTARPETRKETIDPHYEFLRKLFYVTPYAFLYREDGATFHPRSLLRPRCAALSFFHCLFSAANLSVIPVTANTDNLIGASNARWILSVTTTAALRTGRRY